MPSLYFVSLIPFDAHWPFLYSYTLPNLHGSYQLPPVVFSHSECIFLVLVRCPNLTSSANGTVTVLGTSIGSTATYSCDPGFSLNGEAIVNCLENGVWDNLPPTCYSVTGI